MDFKIKSLIGYYFEDENFDVVAFISPTISKKLDFDKTNLPDMFLNKEIKSARWIGFIKPILTGDYTIYTDVSNCIVQVDKKILANSSLQPTKIRLEADKEYRIRIEQQLIEGELVRDYRGITLLWKSETINEEVVPDECLRNLDYSDISEENEFIPNDNFFFSKRMKRAVSDTRDSDRDGIPDSFEIEGYTVINLVVTKWDDELAKQGYKKYISNPYRARTANDPYTDLEKVSGRIDSSVSLSARDPMIAAYPVIGVQMERLVVSKTETISGQVGTNMSKEMSYSSTTSDTNTTDISLELGFSLDAITGGMKVSNSVSHTYQTSSSVSSSSGTSFIQGLSINSGQAAFINPNVRYYNSGTAPVYNVSPNITMTLEGDSLVTVQAQENQVGGFLNPRDYYPTKGLPPIAFNTMDQFNSHLISINYNQLNSIDTGSPIILSISQFTGNFAKLDINGNLQTNGNDWGPYLGQIKSSTANISLDIEGRVPEEVCIAARNRNDINDATPVLTIRDALKKAFDLEEIDNVFYYHGVAPYNNVLTTVIIDKYSETELKRQLESMENKNFLDCELESKMNISIKIREFRSDVIEEGLYYIKSYVGNNNVLGIKDSNNGNVIVSNGEWTDNQKWEVSYDNISKAYKLKNIANNRYLLWNSLVDNSVITGDNPNESDRKWVTEYSGFGSYYLRNSKNVNKALHSGQYVNNENIVDVLALNGDYNQMWIFNPLFKGDIDYSNPQLTKSFNIGFYDTSGSNENVYNSQYKIFNRKLTKIDFSINSMQMCNSYRINLTTIADRQTTLNFRFYIIGSNYNITTFEKAIGVGKVDSEFLFNIEIPIDKRNNLTNTVYCSIFSTDEPLLGYCSIKVTGIR